MNDFFWWQKRRNDSNKKKIQTFSRNRMIRFRKNLEAFPVKQGEDEPVSASFKVEAAKRATFILCGYIHSNVGYSNIPL